MKKIFYVILSVLILCSCGAEPVKENTIYTTFYAMYDFAKEIAGDKMEITELVPSGSGPHDFEPTAADVAKITKSKALIYCGSVDIYVDGIKETAEKAGVQTLDTADGITLDGTDPHIWLSPDNALKQYTAIADFLCKIDNANSAYYKQRLEAVTEKINELKKTSEEITAYAAKKDIIVSHAAYSYLCKYLDITEHSLESGDGGDPTAKQMAEMISYANENDIHYIFAEKGESDKTAAAIAKETGAEVEYLNPLETDTGSGGYFEVMKMNLELIYNAVK